jgi:hypothetical protein
MDFAPYQSSPPEHTRTFSPPHSERASPRTSFDQAGARVWGQRSPPPLHHPQPQRAWSGDGIRSPPAGADGYQSPPQQAYQYQQQAQQQQQAQGWGGGNGMGDYFGSLGQREGMVSEFDTSLGLRLDYEACLAYLAFPPLGAILLLILERKSDYVRYVQEDERLEGRGFDGRMLHRSPSHLSLYFARLL